MRLQKTLLIITLLISGSLIAQEGAKFANWDKDGDGVIERNEFIDQFTDKYFQSWDPSGTKGVLEEGFFKNSYAGLDSDSDGKLTDEEWQIGYNYFYDEYLVYEDLEIVDTDGDGFIEYREYQDLI